MATLENVGSFARAQAQTDSNGLTDTNLIIFANEGLLDFHRQLISHGVDASQLDSGFSKAFLSSWNLSLSNRYVFLESD